jgi:hypothetical protein
MTYLRHCVPYECNLIRALIMIVHFILLVWVPLVHFEVFPLVSLVLGLVSVKHSRALFSSPLESFFGKEVVNLCMVNPL